MVFLKLKEELLLAIVVDFFNAYFFSPVVHFDIRFSLEQLQLSTEMVFCTVLQTLHRSKF